MDINRVGRGPALERVAFHCDGDVDRPVLGGGSFRVATSIAGALLLRRFERGDADRIGAGFAQQHSSPASGDAHVATALGAILIIFPGFITSLLGAVFLSAVRRRAGKVRKGAQFRAHPRNDRDRGCRNWRKSKRRA